MLHLNGRNSSSEVPSYCLHAVRKKKEKNATCNKVCCPSLHCKISATVQASQHTVVPSIAILIRSRINVAIQIRHYAGGEPIGMH